MKKGNPSLGDEKCRDVAFATETKENQGTDRVDHIRVHPAHPNLRLLKPFFFPGLSFPPFFALFSESPDRRFLPPSFFSSSDPSGRACDGNGCGVPFFAASLAATTLRTNTKHHSQYKHPRRQSPHKGSPTLECLLNIHHVPRTSLHKPTPMIPRPSQPILCGYLSAPRQIDLVACHNLDWRERLLPHFRLNVD